MSNEVTTTEQKKPATLKTLLEGDDFKSKVAQTLPKHLKPERFIRVAVAAMNRTPKLMQCTPQSFFKCMIELSSYGLEPDGRRAHLIPYKDQCTLIIDYKGLAELAMRSGILKRIHADVICENDDFEYDMGEIRKHKIDFKKDRGEPFAAYAIAETKDGAMFSQVMTKAEIESIRNSSQGYQMAQRYGKDSPWTSEVGIYEMWKKTAFRRLSKWLPLSAEFRDAVEKEDEDVSFADKVSNAKTAESFELGECPLPSLEAGDSEGVATDATTEEAEKEGKLL
jgi:recombination protein RecT